MKKIFITLFLSIGIIYGDELKTLDALLQSVKNASAEQSSLDKERLEKFISQKAQQEKLLKEAKAKLEQEQQTTINLKATIDTNEKELAQLEETLNIRVGDLGEMFGVVRQIGGDFRNSLKESPTSSIIKGRDEQLGNMLQTKELPDIKALESFWYILSQEIIESGKITTANVDIITQNGESSKADVTIVGEFLAISGDQFLSYDPQTSKFVVLPAQPSSRYTSLAEEFVESSEPQRMVIDPTRGMLLSMLTQKPSLLERVDQGGVIGYIILALGLVGLTIAIMRFIALRDISNRVDAQLANLHIPKEDNPLGRVLLVFDKFKELEIGSFEAKLEEAILKELPKLKKMENMIKLIATVAPLIGLLGTVTGMIETFGAITLFGTGDPKLMAGGISQALMTTVLGLVVAIPMLFLYTFVNTRSNKIVALLDEQSAGLIVKKIDSELK